MTLSRESIVAGLVAQGVPRDRAEAVAEQEIGREQRSPSRFAREQLGVTVAPWQQQQLEADAIRPPPAIAWPVRLLLPWSLLVSDNERKEPYPVRLADGTWTARMRLTARYAKAKEQIAQLAQGKLGDAAAAAQLLELTARVWVPGGRVANDVANFGKGVHDALEGIVYQNDNQLRAVHWLHAGVDVDAPRAELTIAPIATSGG